MPTGDACRDAEVACGQRKLTQRIEIQRQFLAADLRTIAFIVFVNIFDAKRVRKLQIVNF